MTRPRIPAAPASTAAALVLAALGPAQTSPAPVRVVALEGDPAPGTEPGVTFAPFDDGVVPVLIQADGTVQLHAELQGEGIVVPPFGGRGSNGTGLWRESGGTFGLVVRAGDPAPGTDEVFEGFPLNFTPSPGFGREGATGFRGGLPSEVLGVPRIGVWSDREGPIELLALDEAPIPAVPGAVWGGLLGGPRMVPDGAFVVPSLFVLDGADEHGIFRGTGANDLVPVLSTLDRPPGVGAGVVFGDGVSLGANGVVDQVATHPGTTRFAIDAGLDGAGVTSLNDRGIWLETDRDVELVARESDPTPGFPGGQFGSSNGIEPFQGPALLLSANGAAIFGGRVRGSVFGSGGEALWVHRDGGLENVIWGVLPLPESPPGPQAAGLPEGWLHSGITGARISDADRVAFDGPIHLDQDLFVELEGIWWDATGPVTLVAVEDGLVPGEPIPTVYDSFGSFRFVGDALLFEATILGGFVTPDDDERWFLMEPDGGFRTVLTEGDAIDVSGDGTDVRTLAQASLGSGAGEAGEVVMRLTFQDGTSAIAVVGAGTDLLADADEISAATGGAVTFDLGAGAGEAGRDYVLLGGASGTAPGVTFPSGVTLPLNLDAFTDLVLAQLGTAPFEGFAGTLDATGAARATFDTLGPVPGAAVGLTLHFAYVLTKPIDLASDPVAVAIVP